MATYAYYRVSTQTQAEQNGIEMQISEVERYCKENDISIDGVFKDEGISGTRADREGLNDLLATLEKDDKVIVQNTSRLWRNDSVKVMIHHEMKKTGADIISVEQKRSEEHTSELQSRFDLVCRLLLAKKKYYSS